MLGQSLTHSNKVLVLVLVPLMFELALMAGLYVLLQESEREAQKAEHARVITRHINRFHQLMMSAAAGVSGTAISEELLGPGAHNRMERSFLTELEEIEKFASPSSEESRLVAQMRDCVESSVTDLSKLKGSMTTGGLADRVMQLRDIRHMLRKITEKSEKLLEYEQQIADSSPKIQQENRNQFQLLLTFGAVVNVFIVVVLTHLFNKSTTQRLAILQDNSVRLSKKQPLAPPLSGQDEIAQVDQAFHEMADALGRIDRMKQEFLSMVSHDLRTPLTSVKGVLTLLSKGIVESGTEQGQKRISSANQSVDHLIKMIADLLDMERLDAGVFTLEIADSSLRTVIESAAQSVYTFADQNDIVIKAETKDITLPMDEDRVRQVVINLLSNAIKFSPKGSIVSVSCDEHDGFAEVRVTDTGRGIPQEHRQAIFERFKQVEASDSKNLSGSGLGLAICKSIIEAHHGQIGVESQVGAGSCFWFKLSLKRPTIAPDKAG